MYKIFKSQTLVLTFFISGSNRRVLGSFTMIDAAFVKIYLSKMLNSFVNHWVNTCVSLLHSSITSCLGDQKVLDQTASSKRTEFVTTVVVNDDVIEQKNPVSNISNLTEVNVRSAGDVMTLTAVAATVLLLMRILARGCELLKRTREGDLHWKKVSVYINKMGQVILKMMSTHIAGTISKKKMSKLLLICSSVSTCYRIGDIVLEVLKDIPAWPGRHLLEGGKDRRYFALKTVSRGVVEFECKYQESRLANIKNPDLQIWCNDK